MGYPRRSQRGTTLLFNSSRVKIIYLPPRVPRILYRKTAPSSLLTVSPLVPSAPERRRKKQQAMSTMKFCPECNNVLYPKEDKVQSVLLYACRNCDHEEVADDNIVFKMEIRRPANGHPNVAADPSLPRTRNVTCSNCNYQEAVFYQAPCAGEQGLTLFFACCNPSCGHKWRD